MNRQALLSITTLSIALLGSGAAFAQEATSDAWMQTAATKSRVQVNAELQQARRDGTIRFGSIGYVERFTPVASRAAVQAEAGAALRSGEIEVIDAEAHAFTQPRNVATPTVLAGK